MNVEQMLLDTGPAIIHTEGFKLYVEMHLTMLRNQPATVIHTVDKALAYKNEGDLFGYLLDKGVRPMYHHVIMRVSGLTAQFELDDSVNTLLIPPEEIVTKLIQIYQTSEGRV